MILHLPALANTTIDTNTVPPLYVIQEGINCMSTTDYFFTSIKPEPIVVTHHRVHHSKPTVQQAATQDPVTQQTHPLRPGKTRVYPSMLETSTSVKPHQIRYYIPSRFTGCISIHLFVFTWWGRKHRR